MLCTRGGAPLHHCHLSLIEVRHKRRAQIVVPRLHLVPAPPCELLQLPAFAAAAQRDVAGACARTRTGADGDRRICKRWGIALACRP